MIPVYGAGPVFGILEVGSVLVNPCAVVHNISRAAVSVQTSD